ncbi:MAG: mechanosensitive ion channel [Pseudomonadales bacterium]|nr:mechanosensitive ion channel [Pseudomonadales bacterium]
MRSLLTRTWGYIFLLLFLSLPVLADTNLALENVQRQLQRLDPNNKNTAALRTIYLQTIDAYSQADVIKQQIVEFKDGLQTLPGKIGQLKKLLSDEQKKVTVAATPNLPLSKLELELSQLQSSQLELQQNRNNFEKQIIGYSTKPVELRDTLSALEQENLPFETSSPTKAQQLLDAVLFSLKGHKIQAINLQLLVIPLHSEFDRLRLNWTDIELIRITQKIRLFQDQIQLLRQTETDQLLRDLSVADDSQNRPAALLALIAQNKTLSTQLHSSVANTATTAQALRTLEQQLRLIQQSYNVIQQQLELSENSFGIELKSFSQKFASPKLNFDSKQEIAKLRLREIELDQLKLNMVSNSPDISEWSDQSILDLQLLQGTSLDLIDNLHLSYSRELDDMSKILTLQSQIGQQFKKGQSLLTEYLLWLPSVPSIDSSWLKQISQSSRKQFAQGYKYLNKLQFRPFQQWLRWLILYLVVTSVCLLLFRYQRQHEKIWSRQIGNVIQDKFSRSIRLILLAPITSVPIPLLVWIFLQQVLIIENPETLALNQLFSLSIWIYLTLSCWLRRPYGLFISHLDIAEEPCVRVKKLLLPLFVLGVPLIWLLMHFDNIPSLQLHSGLGRLTFILLALLSAVFWAALWKVSTQNDQQQHSISWWQHAKLWLTTLVFIHLALIVAALFGYLFTSLVIMSSLLATTLILYATFSLYRLGMRWLLIAERRISFSRARARRTEILAAREKNEDIPPLEENYLDLRSISDQASALLKAVCFSLMFIAMWLLVKNLLPSLDVLDKVVLWSNQITTASGVISENITLLSVITSMFVIGITILAAYNLPGLLELLILRHINLTPGSCYAITTITRYLLIIICILAGASQFGVEWAKLQWLVAAMGVGLGFGLQEIVANFVSGIIILFEKPVRIGDTVTIGGVTGRVTKIQIRATTISDWDRKEVIIPNKTFVTDQLINWSLSDAITRVLVNVGVAYGSDTELVQRLIQEAATDNPRVLTDPQPEVFFTAFGNSSLDFELRFYVDNLGDRNRAIHEINQQINDSFKRQNVCIAFPQLDVHLHRQK